MVHTAKSHYNLVTPLSSHLAQFLVTQQALIKLINTIQEAGVEVIHGKVNNIHTSGHGGQQEQKTHAPLDETKNTSCRFTVNTVC